MNLKKLSENRNTIRVAIAGADVGRQNDQLQTVVGSCVGIMLYDKKIKLGGMVHIMLDYAKDQNDNPCKYADTGIDYLFNLMLKNGAALHRLIGAKIAGGAAILTRKNEMNVARNNLIAVKKVLRQRKITIIAADCGGHTGRNIMFDIPTGKVLVKPHNGLQKIL